MPPPRRSPPSRAPARPAGPAAGLPTLLASGFLSVPPRLAPHERITLAAARRCGVSRRGARHLRRAIRAVDMDEMVCRPPSKKRGILRANDDYKPSHHCDRPVGWTHEQALAAAARHARAAFAEAVARARAGQDGEAWEALGQALHTVQDVYSHSDAAETLGEEDVGDDGLPTRPIRITSFEPCSPESGKPPGDLYPHDEHAKDVAGYNEAARALLPDGRTAYEAAYALAERATEKVLRMFRREVGMQRWAEMQRPRRHRPRRVAATLRPNRAVRTREARR